MNFLDLANLLDNDGNMQNEMMVMAFAATLLSTIPVLLGNEFDINVGLKKKRKKREVLLQGMWKNVEELVSILSPTIQSLDPMNDSLAQDLEVNKTRKAHHQHSLNDAESFHSLKMNARKRTDNRLVVLKSILDDEEIGTST